MKDREPWYSTVATLIVVAVNIIAYGMIIVGVLLAVALWLSGCGHKCPVPVITHQIIKVHEPCMDDPPDLPLLTWPKVKDGLGHTLIDEKTERQIFYILFSLRNYVTSNFERCRKLGRARNGNSGAQEGAQEDPGRELDPTDAGPGTSPQLR